MKNYFDIYSTNRTMEVLGKQIAVDFKNEDFYAVINAHEEAPARDNTLFHIALDFFTLGVIYGQKKERAKRNHKEITPIK